MLRMQRNFGSSLNLRLAAGKGLTGLVHVLYPTGKSDPCAQTYRFISCCEKRRSDTACVSECYLKYVEGNHNIILSSGEESNNNIKYEIHGIIGTPTSRRLSAVGSAYTYNWYLLYHINDEFWVESGYDMDLWRCSCSTGSWRIHC